MISNEMMPNVHECWTRFLVMLMALVLSQKIGIICIETLKLLNYCFIHKICAQQLPVAIYSASVVERAKEFWFLLEQETSMWPRNW